MVNWEDLDVNEVNDASQRTALLRGFMQTSASIQGEQFEQIEKGALLGIWRIEGLLGKGGMGVVYEVSRADGEFHQRAALKLMHAANKQARNRFVAERERLASLEHQGINRIIDGGNSSEGEPYMVVELVNGYPIDVFVSNNNLSIHEILRLLIKLLHAVGYSHERLVLHRDIKASNVLVDEFGEPRLIDFGVASLLDTEKKRSGPLTIAYAAPEMITNVRLTVSADLFSVAILAHQLLSGSLPDRDSQGAAIVQKEKFSDLDLVAIIKKATAADPSCRYSSASAFKDDLLAYLQKRPVTARNGNKIYQIHKFVTRNIVASVLSVGIILSLLAGIISTSVMASRAANEAKRANIARSDAEYALGKAQRNFRVQEAYADALHRVFGGKDNSERMTAIVRERAEQAYAYSASDPQRAAEIIFAVGRNFVERNDYKTASEVLERWVAQGFGDPELLIDGKLNLALAHRYQGRTDIAATLFKEVIEHYDNTPSENSYEHLVAIVQLTALSNDLEMQVSTLERLNQAINRGGSIEDLAFYLNSVSSMHRIQGDFTGAEEATKSVHALLEANPLVEIAGREAILGNKAMYAIFVSGDLKTARQDVDRLINELSEDKGASSLTAYSYELSSAIALNMGEFERAIVDGKIASETAEKLSGIGSAYHIGTTSTLVEALVAAQQLDKAKSLLQSLSETVSNTSRKRDTRFALAKAFYLASVESNKSASIWLKEANVTKALTERTPLYQFRMNRLEKLGVQAAANQQ